MSDSTDRAADEAAENALRRGLRANALSPEALQRIRQATEAEWRSQVTQAPPRRSWSKLAAAASVLLAVSAGVFGVMNYNQRGAAGEALGMVARAESPGVARKQLLRGDIALPQGSSLHVAASLEVRGDALIELAGGGNLRVARGSALEITDSHTIRLQRGELYVDIAPGTRTADAFRVVTPAGEFRHVGTQFAVAIVDDQTRLRVREGSVVWTGGAADTRVDAGTEVTIDASRRATRRALPTAGREWAWAEALAPEIDIEDRPLREFLDWFSRETGRRLVLGDDAARELAASTRMHGSVRGLSALEALSAVMAATTLRYELPEGVIRVSSTGDPRPSN